jgi:3-hydroxyisobutyrate dehydrogenase-like beta-hydroxyacid dehydrogenase
MSFATVAIVAPGDMGHAIGRLLGENGIRVVTNLAGRTADLAKAAGIEDLGSDAALLETADAIWSVMPPDKASAFTGRLAQAAESAAGRPLLVDLNAISPGTAKHQAGIATAAGFDFVDGGIIGGPPYPGRKCPRLYVSGPRAVELTALNDRAMDFRVLGDAVGSASAIKMCYATLTKGLTALAVQSLVVARAEGVDTALAEELGASQAAIQKHIQGFVPGMPPKAYRWIGEMEEIAASAREVGLPAGIFEGVADLFRAIEASPLGAEIVEKRTMGETPEEVARILLAYLGARDTTAK